MDSALLTNIDANLAPTVDFPNPVNTVTSPIIVDSNTASCFRWVVQTTETEWQTRLISGSDQLHRGHASIFAIELLNKAWCPTVLSKYVPADYSDDIDNGVFNYANYSETVFWPKEKWDDRDRSDIITFDYAKDNEELSKGLKIDKSIEIQTTWTIRSLVVKYWDYFCDEGTKWTILHYKFTIDTGALTPVCCRKPTYGQHKEPLIME